jgi:Gram-positive signal peptide protein, YSIRK family
MSSIFKQSIFSFRKLKGIGLASVILGALLVAGPVHADSTTWDNGETSITVYDGHAKSFTNGKTAKELYDEKQYCEQPYEDNDSKQQKLYPYENKPVNQDGEKISPSQIVASEYLEDYQKRCRQNWKRNRRQSSRPQSYDIDMEMADCYFGYSAEDFC